MYSVVTTVESRCMILMIEKRSRADQQKTAFIKVSDLYTRVPFINYVIIGGRNNCDAVR